MAREAIEEALEELGLKGRRTPESVREAARAALRKLIASAEAENERLRRPKGARHEALIFVR